MAVGKRKRQEQRKLEIFHIWVLQVSDGLELDLRMLGRERKRKKDREKILFFYVWAVRVPGVLICDL